MDSQDITFKQWNKTGDHPDVQPLNDPKFNHNKKCPKCDKKFSEHGLIPEDTVKSKYSHLSNQKGKTVCPGDYVYKTTNENGFTQHVVVNPEQMKNISSSVEIGGTSTTVDTKVQNFDKLKEDINEHSVKVKKKDEEVDTLTSTVKQKTETVSETSVLNTKDLTHNGVKVTENISEEYDLTVKKLTLTTEEVVHDGTSVRENLETYELTAKSVKETTTEERLIASKKLVLECESFEINKPVALPGQSPPKEAALKLNGEDLGDVIAKLIAKVKDLTDKVTSLETELSALKGRVAALE